MGEATEANTQLNKASISGWSALLGEVVCFALLATLVTGLTRQRFSAVVIVAFAMFFSVCSLASVTWWQGNLHKLAKVFASSSALFSHVPLVVCMGFLSPFLYFTLFSGSLAAVGKGYEYKAYSINALWPIILLLGSQVLEWRFLSVHLLAVSLGFAGAAVLFAGGDLSKLGMTSFHISNADALALGGAATFAYYNLLLRTSAVKRLENEVGTVPMILTFQLVSLTCASIAVVISFATTPKAWVSPNLIAVLLVAAVDILPFGVAYVFLYHARSKLPIGIFSVAQYCVPVLALLLYPLVYGEPIGRGYWGGVACVVAAGVLTVIDEMREQARGNVSASMGR